MRLDKAFRTAAGHLEAEQFWTALEDAERYLGRLERMGLGPNHIVEVRVLATDFACIAAIVVDSRPARSVDESELAWFNGCVVDIVLPERESPDG
ncbi:MAG: hypothetical protein JWN10_1363 [Solirubrobacterales bacterium]|nr:hypothetical protein [Solirubrobacterales bacterium]